MIWYTNLTMSYRYTHLTPLLSGWPTILFLSGLGMLLAILLSFLPSLEYSSTTRLLITQQLGAVDAYTAGRSAERIAEDLSNAVYTSTFYDSVLAEEHSIDLAFFPEDELKRRKKWDRAVNTSVSRSTGLLTIRAYHPDPVQANAIASIVASVLVEEGWTYTSGGNVTIQVVDEAVNSRFPVRPNIFVNGFSGLILGGLAGVGYLLIQSERVKRRHQLVHED
jgi:capsular polysaccharide biosynthesis protein